MADALKFETICATAGVSKDGAYRAVSPPLYLSANFAWESPEDKPQYDYSRSGNPTREQLESAVAELEGAASGVVVSSGMAALNLVLNLVSPGEKVLAPHDCYGGTHRLLEARARQGHFELVFVDQSDAQALAQAFTAPPKLVLIETPSNPLLRITDIRACVKLAKACGAITVADNTFLSPLFQKPLELGCDVVVHSTTKFLNGHSDVVGGAVLSREKDLGEELAWWANCTGVTGAAFDAFLTLRGIRTLSPRLLRQQETTLHIVDTLQGDDRVARVNYPGIETHPGHAIAKQQQSGFGSMFSVELVEGIDVVEFLKQLDHFSIAESLGGFESLVCLPAMMTHAAMPPAAREVAGIGERLVRFSIGLEHEKDLERDILAALDRAGVAGANNPDASGKRLASG